MESDENFSPFATPVSHTKKSGVKIDTTGSAIRITFAIFAAISLHIFCLLFCASFFYFSNPDEYSIGNEIIYAGEIFGAAISFIALYLLVNFELKYWLTDKERKKVSKNNATVAER